MSECKIDPSTKATDASFPASLSDERLLDMAHAQATIHTGPSKSAAQRAYNMAVRREIRRRGLDWQPPRSRNLEEGGP